MTKILTKEEVSEIRKLLKAGMPNNQIAEIFGVTKDAISQIKLGKTWRTWKEKVK